MQTTTADAAESNPYLPGSRLIYAETLTTVASEEKG